MALGFPTTGEQQLALTFGKTLAIAVGVDRQAVATTHPFYITGQFGVRLGEGHATAMTKGVATALELVVQADALIKNKTFTTPATLGGGYLTQIVEDATLQVIHLIKTLLQ
jgi:hypothetical protein